MKKISLILIVSALFSLNKVCSNALTYYRVYGSDRYKTAVEISKINSKNTDSKTTNKPKTVILVNAHNLIDAVPGSILANQRLASILLVKKDIIPTDTLNEIERIKPKKIFILGGNLSISEGVINQLKEVSEDIVRIGGSNRYETSELIAKEIEKETDIDGYLVTSNPYDAISASSLGGDSKPILYIKNNTKPKILENTNSNILVLGGTKSISEETYLSLGADKRINGDDRFETSLKIAEASGYKNSIIANGYNLSDALSATFMAYLNNAGIILCKKDYIDKASMEFLNKSEKIILIGGKNSVKDETLQKDTTQNESTKKINNPTNNTSNKTINKPNNKNTFEYWNYYNHYSENIIYSSEQIDKINKYNIAKSKYLHDPFSIKAKYYGYISDRTVMKNTPVSKKDTSSFDDYSAETGLFPWDKVAVLQIKNNWAKVVCYDYEGWILKNNIAFTDKNDIKKINDMDKITITSRQVKLKNKKILDMGTQLPLIKSNDNYYTVLLPKSGENFFTEEVQIKKSDATLGYLPFTQSNVIRQSLKFLGERYGWGHSNSTRDCSGFIRDVYRSFGIIMPRNTSAQGTGSIGKTIDFISLKNHRDREAQLLKQKPGNTLYLPGHTMLYLGRDENNIPNVVHSYGSHYSNGQEVRVFKNTITDTRIKTKSNKTFLEVTNTIKDFYNLEN